MHSTNLVPFRGTKWARPTVIAAPNSWKSFFFVIWCRFAAPKWNRRIHTHQCIFNSVVRWRIIIARTIIILRIHQQSLATAAPVRQNCWKLVLELYYTTYMSAIIRYVVYKIKNKNRGIEGGLYRFLPRCPQEEADPRTKTFCII